MGMYVYKDFFQAELSELVEGLEVKDKGKERFKNGQEKVMLGQLTPYLEFQMAPLEGCGEEERYVRWCQVKICLQPHREEKLPGDGWPQRLSIQWSIQ